MHVYNLLYSIYSLFNIFKETHPPDAALAY